VKLHANFNPTGRRDDQEAAPMTYPLITIERAKAIADGAVIAGLASWSGQDGGLRMTPVFRAELARHGVGRLLGLAVDQAEQVETFVSAYAQGSRYAEGAVA
jgi:hypothetical protein